MLGMVNQEEERKCDWYGGSVNEFQSKALQKQSIYFHGKKRPLHIRARS